MRVLRVVGIESEAEVAFAALHLMFARDADRVRRAARPAGRGAAGRVRERASAPVDRMLVGRGDADAAVGARRRPAAAVPARRCPVVRPVLDRRAAVRGPAAARRSGRDGLRRPGRRAPVPRAPAWRASRCRGSDRADAARLAGRRPARCRARSPTASSRSPAATRWPSSSWRPSAADAGLRRRRSRRCRPRAGSRSTSAGRCARCPSATRTGAAARRGRPRVRAAIVHRPPPSGSVCDVARPRAGRAEAGSSR